MSRTTRSTTTTPTSTTASDSASTEAPPRNARHAELIPEDRLRDTAVVIIGCGAIGSWLGRFLAHVGVPHLTLVDHDVVAPENIALQGYTTAHLGEPKVHALGGIVRTIHPYCTIARRRRKFDDAVLDAQPAGFRRRVVFSCVDSIDARRDIYRAVDGRCDLFVDGRMAGLAWRVLAVDRWPDAYYGTTLFAAGEAEPVRCTAKGTVCTAAQPAGVMAMRLIMSLRGAEAGDPCLPRDVQGNMMTGDTWSTDGP